MEPLLSFLLYSGLAGAVAGAALWLFRSLRGKRVGFAAAMAVGGNLLLAAAMLWPVTEKRSATPTSTKLDELIPVYQFDERHEIDIKASPEAIDRAIREVTAGEIRMFEMLTSIRRHFGKNGEPILNPPASKPILETALSGGFHVLADEPGREMVIGSFVLKPRDRRVTKTDLRDGSVPGCARALMNFRIEQRGAGVCRLTTETRVQGTDASAANRFRWYWRMIYYGSSIIRHYWLEAIAQRAIGASAPAI